MSYFASQRTLRNSKTSQFRQKSITKKNGSQKKITKNCYHTLSFLSSSTTVNCNMHENIDYGYDDKSVIVSNNDLNEDDFHTTFKNKPFSIILNEDPFDDRNNQSSLIFTNFETDCLSNDVPHKKSNVVKPEAHKMPDSIVKNKFKLAVLSSKPQRKNNTLKPTTCCNYSIGNQSADVRITRGKLKQLQIQKIKELDQSALDKYGCRKLPVIVLENITQKIRFFSKLGLKYCHKVQ